MKVIYVGHAKQVSIGRVVADRHGEPVDLPNGAELVKRGDFIKFEPEPKQAPVKQQDD